MTIKTCFESDLLNRENLFNCASNFRGDYVEDQSITSFHEIIRELADIESRLEMNIDTTLWISDPHGAGERFVSILKGRFGLVWRSAYEALAKTFSNEKLEHIDRIIKKEIYRSR